MKLLLRKNLSVENPLKYIKQAFCLLRNSLLLPMLFTTALLLALCILGPEIPHTFGFFIPIHILCLTHKALMCRRESCPRPPGDVNSYTDYQWEEV